MAGSAFFLIFMSSVGFGQFFSSKELCFRELEELQMRVTLENCKWDQVDAGLEADGKCDGNLKCKITDPGAGSDEYPISRGQCTLAPGGKKCIALTGPCKSSFLLNERLKCNSIKPDPHFYPLNGPIPPTGSM